MPARAGVSGGRRYLLRSPGAPSAARGVGGPGAREYGGGAAGGAGPAAAAGLSGSRRRAVYRHPRPPLRAPAPRPLCLPPTPALFLPPPVDSLFYLLAPPPCDCPIFDSPTSPLCPRPFCALGLFLPRPHPPRLAFAPPRACPILGPQHAPGLPLVAAYFCPFPPSTCLDSLWPFSPRYLWPHPLRPESPFPPQPLTISARLSFWFVPFAARPLLPLSLWLPTPPFPLVSPTSL